MKEEKEEKHRGRIKQVFVLIVVIFLIGLLVAYWFLPLDPVGFKFSSNSNFSIEVSEEEMQFYPNMRFPSYEISYTIDEMCSLQKQEDMRRAFELIEQDTLLDFYPMEKNGLIYVACDDTNKVKSGLFIAGEGGPVNISIGKYYNVIHAGEILLIKNSVCERPNVAIHELLHVLGFNHSENPGNIMYPISKCRQTIGEDTIARINELYSVPQEPDLEFENASVTIKGRMMNLDFTVRNQGLKDSYDFGVIVYMNGKQIKDFYSDGLEIGFGERIQLSNHLVPNLKIDEIKMVIKTPYSELDKENNEIILDIVE